jgi:hypothetical protein
VRKRLSVRDTEAYVRRTLAESPAKAGGGTNTAPAQRDSGLKDVESRLRRALGTRVTVIPQRAGARITIECYSSEEFRNVVAQLLGGEDEEEDA